MQQTLANTITESSAPADFAAASAAPLAARDSRRCVMHVTWSMVAGGAEIYALSILRHLDPALFRGAICAIDQGGALEQEFADLDIPCQIMHRKPGIEWSLVWRLYRLFRKHRVDVVHTHHFNQIFYSATAARLAGARLIHTEHSVELFDRRRRRVAMKLLSMLCDRVLVVGENVKSFMRDRVGIAENKLRVMYAGVPVPVEIQDRALARKELGLETDAKIILIVARLYPEKNHLLLLNAFARVLARIPGARLLIAGSGIEADSIRAQIDRDGLNGSVQMLGVRRDISRLMAACDVVALPSLREGLPLVILEAMAAARPVVASRVGDVPAVVQDGVTGRLVPPGDRAALADALIELLENPSRAAEMGRRGREQVASRFDIRTMVAHHEAIYAAK